MKFLYPQFLWALLILLIPIIIHLFNFKRYKTLYFSSLSFVKYVDQKTKSTQSLKHILVLLARLFTFLFLVFAFAQPYFPTNEKENSTLEAINSIYIDNSFSMQAMGTEGELLSQARENARQLISDSPLDTRFMISTNDLSGREERVLSKVEALEKLDLITFSAKTRTIPEILQWQMNGFAKKNLLSSTSINSILLSDFQYMNSENKKIENLDKIALFPVKVEAENQQNIYIDSVWFTSPIHKKNTKNELNIRIQNKGFSPNQSGTINVELIIDIAEFHKSIFVDLPYNQEKITQIGYMDKSNGQKEGKIQLVDNHLYFDDIYYFSYQVNEFVNTLIINGEDAIENIELVLNLDNYFKTSLKEITAVTKTDFENIDIVYVNGANEISNGFTNYLVDFVENGGTVALFPGTQANSSWNSLLQILHLPQIGKKIHSGTKINSIEYNDPFFDGVFEKRSQHLNLPSVSTIFQPLLSNTTRSSALINLQNGLPLFAKVQEKGNAFMFYSSLHDSFGNFPKDALFPTLILRMAELSQRQHPLFMIIGSESSFPIYKKLSSEEIVHIQSPDFDYIPPMTSIAGVNFISLKDASNHQKLNAGNYSLMTSNKIGTLSLNYDRNESDLSTFDQNTLKQQLNQLGAKKVVFNKISSDSNFSTIAIDKPFSFWKLCIVLTLIFVVIEMLLIRFLN